MGLRDVPGLACSWVAPVTRILALALLAAVVVWWRREVRRVAAWVEPGTDRYDEMVPMTWTGNTTYASTDAHWATVDRGPSTFREPTPYERAIHDLRPKGHWPPCALCPDIEPLTH